MESWIIFNIAPFFGKSVTRAIRKISRKNFKQLDGALVNCYPRFVSV